MVLLSWILLGSFLGAMDTQNKERPNGKRVNIRARSRDGKLNDNKTKIEAVRKLKRDLEKLRRKKKQQRMQNISNHSNELVNALESEDLDCLRALLDRTDPNIIVAISLLGPYKQPGVFWAALLFCNLEMVKLFLEYGARQLNHEKLSLLFALLEDICAGIKKREAAELIIKKLSIVHYLCANYKQNWDEAYKRRYTARDKWKVIVLRLKKNYFINGSHQELERLVNQITIQ